MDELAVFLGASYFRSKAAGQGYGISARGLAIDSGQPRPEEFPIFRSFWIERPGPRATSITVHALLDSPSICGAYTFEISYHVNTVMEIDAELFPRKRIAYAGIAPLTSMFRSGPQDKPEFWDYRPRVYDSEVLMIWNGRDERILRPLINPQQVQFSAFMDNGPRGFGLVMRGRDFRDFQDLQVRYELRPNLWVEPLGDWGEGSVDLIELPTPNEYNDNIVAFWHPKEPLEPGKSYSYRYRLHWCWDPPVRSNVALVSETRIAPASKPGWHGCHLDFRGPLGFNFCDSFSRICPNKRDNLQITASGNGKIGDIYFEQNPVLGGYRLSFDFLTDGVEKTDLRAVVLSHDRPISEIWTYRWTA
jgi:glucans biosynthesis protein